ncbi:hypothetical protein I3843_08G030000 [Carya illinoinensis]|nr:hypothetical protein I3843_08G030000 [Carya illinoinensis]
MEFRAINEVVEGSDRRVATRTVFFMTDADGAKKRSSNEAFEAKRLHFRSEQCSNSEKYNHSSVDDKRVVPTGSNPLHNK